jgi:hypothetical protein
MKQLYGSVLKTISCAALVLCACFAPVLAQEALQIEWQVTNRFRLFSNQADFEWYVVNSGSQPGHSVSVLATEQTLIENTNGRGWAARISHLCFDTVKGGTPDTCNRDGLNEAYLNPKTVSIRLDLSPPANLSNAQCAWKIGAELLAPEPCTNSVERRVAIKARITVSVVATSPTAGSRAASTTVQVRDVFIVGLGDSFAAGEGNPDRPVQLSEQGFCFRRFGGGAKYFLPGRANIKVDANCPEPQDQEDQLDEWQRAAAGWLFAPCHLSLYGYQTRAALALAVEQKHLSVTYLPLGCTGATIQHGLTGSQQAKERPKVNGTPSPKIVEAQLSHLRRYVKESKRQPDLVFLTIGGNDAGFSGLVADAIVTGPAEREVAIADRQLTTPADAAKGLTSILKSGFSQLRAQLKDIIGSDFTRVVFVTYPNPGTLRENVPCPTTRTGFDAHPAFSVNGAELKKVWEFVETQMLPTLKENVAAEAMTYEDHHRLQFMDHGFCAEDASDPPFDRDCFRNGDSFQGASDGLATPLTCPQHAPEFRPYAKRARWFRTANDSYFTAMTYPSNSAFNPSDIHDAVWGLYSAESGGALHPTAEGHAAMADAALVSARKLLHLEETKD